MYDNYSPSHSATQEVFLDGR
ncbi:hypothetical protein [Eisenbergiella massiliensis]